MINDGYGDGLTPTELLAMWEQRVQVIAHEHARPGAEKEDLAQEARIALWKQAPKYPGDDMSGGLATVIIRHAIAPAAEYQRWTGTADGTKGKPRDPLRRTPDSLDAPLGNADEGAEVTTLADSLLLETPDVIDGLEMAYHRGEILRAINELSDEHREYVYLKFWRGMSEAEIGAALGRTKGNVNRTWLQVIRPRLREKLAHLAH